MQLKKLNVDVMEDLDFADDVVLHASRYLDIQDKTYVMAEKLKVLS